MKKIGFLRERLTHLSGSKAGSFAGDVLKLVSGTTFAQVFAILVAPFLTRLYAPASFGVFAIFLSITSIITVTACMRYELSIMLPETDAEAANLLGGCLGLVVVISALTIPLILMGRGPLLHYLNSPELGPYLWMVTPLVFVGGVLLALNYWNSRTKHFGRLSICRMISSVSTGSAQVGSGYAGLATGGSLIGASLFGQTLATAVLGRQVWRDHGELLRKSVSFRGILQGLWRFRKFPLMDLGGALLNNVSWQLPALFLAFFFSNTIVGFYALADRVIKLPMSLVGAAISQVFYQRASEVRGDRPKLAEVVQGVFRRLVALAMFPALLLTFLGRDFFEVVFGNQWSEAGIFVQILGLWMFFWFISSPLSTIFAVLERQELALVVNLAIFGTRIASLLVGGMLKSVYLCLVLFAGSGIIVYGGYALWNLTLAGVRLRASALILGQYIIYSIPGIALLILLKRLSLAPVWLTLLAGVELLVYYLLILRHEPEVWQSLRTFAGANAKN
jgi:O-antigen/teichoic acid export membrane protein